MLDRYVILSMAAQNSLIPHLLFCAFLHLLAHSIHSVNRKFTICFVSWRSTFLHESLFTMQNFNVAQYVLDNVHTYHSRVVYYVFFS